MNTQVLCMRTVICHYSRLLVSGERGTTLILTTVQRVSMWRKHIEAMNARGCGLETHPTAW